MTNYILTPTPKQQYFDNNGDPLSGGKLYSFAAGTSTPLATYTSSTGAASNPNPVILDSRGEAGVWLQSGVAYKLRLTNAAGAEIWTVDNVADNLLDLPAALAGSGGSALVGFIQAGSGAVAMTAQAKMRQYVNVDDYGAVGDGTTDDTSAIQNAITYAQTAGHHMEVRFSAKAYNVVGTLTVTGPVRLVGEGYLDFQNARPITIPPNGTWLIHSSTTGPLLQFTGDLGKSCGVTNIAIFESGHPTPGVGWLPAVHDWVIRNENTYGTLVLDRVHFHGVYLGVYTNNAARPSYENITGQFFYRAFEFDQIFDLGKLEGLHAWTYWSENDYVLQWQQANCIGLTIRRVDGLWLDRIFTFANNVAVYVTAGATTAGTGRVITIGGLYADFTGRALWIDSTVAHVTIGSVFHLGQAWPPAAPPVTISGSCTVDITAGSNHNVQIGHMYSVLCAGSAIRLDGTSNQVWIADAIVEQFDRSATGVGVVTSTSLTNIVHFATQLSKGTYSGAPAYISTSATVNANVPTKRVAAASEINIPVTAGSAGTAYVPFTVESTAADASVGVVAKGIGVVVVGESTNALAFYGGSSAVKGTVTGACAGNTAIKNLLTYLAARGLLVDGTTA